MIPLRSVVFAIGAVAALWDIPAHAFDSFITNPQHGSITANAAGTKGYAAAAIKALQDENALVDSRETWLRTVWTKKKVFGQNVDVPVTFLAPTAKYMFSHHFDRGRVKKNEYRSIADTFKDSAAYVVEQVKDARTAANGDKPDKALVALARALHALQDMSSHSNLVNLAAGDQPKVLDAVFGGGALPQLAAALQLTSYVTTDETEFPTDDPENYTHGTFAKDSAKKNDEAKGKPDGADKPRFELAYDLAVAFSERLLDEFAKGLAAAKLNAVKGANPAAAPPVESCEASAPFTPGTPFTLGPVCNGTTLALPDDTFDSSQTVRVAVAPLTIFRETAFILTPDSNTIGLLREIGPFGVAMNASGVAEVDFTLAELRGLDADSLHVYRLSPDSADGAWVYAPNETVSVDGQSGNGVAAFDVPATGLYGIGGAAGVPPPGTQHPVAGTRLFLRDESDPARPDRLNLIAFDPAIQLPAQGGLDDPALGGATLTLVNATTFESATFVMPPTDGTRALWRWSRTGYTLVYRNRQAPAGGPSHVRSMLLRPGRLKVRARGLEGFTLDEASQGNLVAIVSMGLTRYCTTFAPGKDHGLPLGAPGLFVSNDQPPPSGCDTPAPPLP